MTNSVSPVLLSINVCDQVIREERTRKTSLIGMFNNINAKEFPCHHPCLHVHISVTDGGGKQIGKLRFVNEDLGKLVLEMKGDVVFPSRMAIVEMNFRIVNLPLEKSGHYRFEFMVGDTLIGGRCFTVNQIHEKKK